MGNLPSPYFWRLEVSTQSLLQLFQALDIANAEEEDACKLSIAAEQKRRELNHKVKQIMEKIDEEVEAIKCESRNRANLNAKA